jgi:hypothetical protein
MSVLGEKNRQVGPDFSLKNIFEGCRKRRDGSDYPMKAQIRVWQGISSEGERSWAKQLNYLGAVSLVPLSPLRHWRLYRLVRWQTLRCRKEETK